ncbi:SMI1/KNR4 family protein [Pararoseomonas sp. SCSIO 73927]|uniref:SMI1/KNR4 family protein n=1 Tax=Pararoseomonas sp. SCSIO 73927 TaxID=3114537 RepID=UPI0030D15DF2
MSDGWTPYLRSDFPEAGDEDRARIEAETGHRLPEDYWRLARANQGRVPDPEYVRLEGGGRARIGVFLFLIERERVTRTGERSYGLLSAFRGAQEMYPAGIVPFSDDTGGNFMAFDYRGGGEPAIVFLDHETEGEAGITRVAPDFGTMMGRREAE